MKNKTMTKILVLALSFLMPSILLAQSSSLMVRNPTLISEDALPVDAQRILSKLRTDSKILSFSMLRLEASAFNSNVISLSVGGSERTFVKSYSEIQPDGSQTWVGKSGKLTHAIFSSKDGKISGTIRSEDGIFEIAPLSGNVHTISKINSDIFQIRDDSPAPASSRVETGQKLSYSEAESDLRRNSPEVLATAAAVTNPPVRILVVYSAHAAAALGSKLDTQINQAIASINDINIDSTVPFRAVLAGKLQVSYTGPYDFASTLQAFKGMAIVLQAHDEFQADLMVMLENSPNTTEAGLAAAINATPQNAYAVVSTTYMVNNLSFAHEVGHLMGADHPQPDTTKNVFKMGHGTWVWRQINFYSDSSACYHSVMSYPISLSKGVGITSLGHRPACVTDNRIEHWSDPQYIDGFGNQMGAVGTNDNAQLLTNQGAAFSNYHLTVLNSVAGIGNPTCGGTSCR